MTAASLYRAIAQNLPDTSVFLFDRQLRILVAEGPAVLRLPWVDEDMFRERMVTDLHGELPSDVLALSLGAYGAALGGERRAFDFTSDGLTYEVTAVPVRGEDGQVEAALAVVRDITERLAAEGERARLAAIDAATALEDAEQSAGERESRLQALLDHAPVPVRLRALDGSYLVINRACAELLGITVEEALEQAPYAPHIADYFDEQEYRVLSGEGASTIEVSGVDAEGVSRDYLATKFPVNDSDGAVVAVGGIWLDVTERKRAQRALAGAEERYRELFEGSPTGIAQVAIDGTPMSINSAWASLVGYSSTEQFLAEVSSTRDLYVDPAERDALTAQLLEHGEAKGVEVRLRRRDGSVVWVSMDTAAIRDQRGAIVAIQGSGVDISERKTMQEALLESEERFRLLAENSSDLIRLYSADRRISYASPSSTAVLGYSPEELVGHRSSEFQHPDEITSLQGRRHAVIASEDEVAVIYRSRCKDGGYVWLEASVRALRDERTDEVIGYQEAARDITERKRFEQELRETNVALETANRAKDDFLSSMSHELRTPLNSILGFTGTLLMGLRGPLNDDQRDQLLIVQRTGRHLLSLINELLDLAKIESGETELRLESIDCRELLEEVVDGLRPLAQEKALALEARLPAAPVRLISDRRALTQILINLTNNAIKFTDVGSVRLEVDQLSHGDRPATTFAVLDTGRGIAERDQARLFVAFQQIRTPGTSVAEGAGLGLHISQTLARLIGAQISVRSVLGQGSTFEVTVFDDAGGALSDV